MLSRPAFAQFSSTSVQAVRTRKIATMPTTRSATRAQTQATQPSAEVPTAAPKNAKMGQITKRKAANAPADASGKKKRVAAPKADTEPAQATRRPTVPPSDSFIPVLLPAKLTFSLEEAKAHLSRADKRFEDVFNRLPCKPFEKLERVEPFRTLTTSILGQQISWMAARSITHKFIRLYFPHLPEKPDDNFWAKGPDAPFPTPHQVAATDVPTLRTAGLSARKAEYVQDLAARFADGRLTSQKLFDADDEELHEMLTAVRGIGRWTVDMFAIFSLRRPDIMPLGDLGVQRGVLRWFLSLHHSTYRIEISPQKLPKDPNEEQAKPKKPESSQAADDADALPVLNAANDADALPVFDASAKAASRAPETPTPDASVLLPIPAIDIALAATPGRSADRAGTPARLVDATPSVLGLPSMPVPFTPSINQTLEGSTSQGAVPRPLPGGMTAGVLKSRLDGKKKIKGAILTPQEMEELTEHWKPYRSIGVYYMWALAEEK